MEAIFITRTYDETMTLLVEARDYLSYGEPFERARLTAGDRLKANCEAMRITSRLTQVMAWLLVQRAVAAGEISLHEAVQEPHRLSGQAVCHVTDAFPEVPLPNGLRSLLDRSHALYRRIERLDQMVASRAA
ncbi:MAG: DUF1465 family protein [Alphaproteobacteria bacterium]|nr:MAG: DUF1465 family protein [Alphaproteobacteria bacterium]